MLAEFPSAVELVVGFTLTALAAVVGWAAVSGAKALALLVWEGFVSVLKRRLSEHSPGKPSKRR